MTWQANRYIADVLSGQQVACHWVKQACQRHIDDLRDGPARGLRFDEAAAAHVLKFFTILKHSKGEWAGKPIELEPWQQFMLWTLFGWKRADGTRRFRTAYIEVARKNGKSTLGAGVGLYLLAADGEPGAEIYSAATKRDQARITHLEAVRMVRASPMLKRRIRTFRDNLNIEGTASKFEPLGADADTTDGLNIHGAIVDEIHAHKTREMWDRIDTATGARRQPLLFGITTAGYDRKSLCWVLNEYSKKVLDRVVEDDTYFGLIYTLDDGTNGTVRDDWQDEATWVKANPNLRVSKKIDDLRRKCARAIEMPSAQNSFMRLELNIWTQSETKWMPIEHWRQCGLPLDYSALSGRKCYAGLDLSSTLDLTAFVLVFPPAAGEDVYLVLPRFWIPESNMLKRSHDDRVPYDVWTREKFIEATPGDVIDYEYIFAQVDRDMRQFAIEEVAFDRWGASRVTNVLQDRLGFTTDAERHKLMRAPLLIEFGQGFASMSPPMKELERLVMSHKIAHGNNPVLNWMADNVVATLDAAGNIKPDKERSREKIDGIVALLMALDRAIRHTPQKSIYGERGVRVL
jgi:phage terminase large subunit-like protein